MKQSSRPNPASTRSNAGAAEQLLQEVIVRTPQPPARADGIAIATFAGLAADGGALVSIATFGLQAISARSVSAVVPEHIGQALAVGFEGGDPMKPIILGLMLAAAAAPKPAPASAVLDGEAVVLSAEREIELRCGDAAIILSADGRIELRGTYITSHASATQRLLGGSVNIN